MSGTPLPGEITIPSIMISNSDGIKIIEALGNGIVNASLKESYSTAKGTTVIPGIFFINDVIVRNNNGTSEVYIAAATSRHRDAASHIFGPDDYGLWKSIDAGSTWQKIAIPIEGSTIDYQPMDFEIDPNKQIFLVSLIDNNKFLYDDKHFFLYFGILYRNLKPQEILNYLNSLLFFRT